MLAPGGGAAARAACRHHARCGRGRTPPLRRLTPPRRRRRHRRPRTPCPTPPRPQKAMSVREVTTYHTYNNGLPVKGGLNDPALGAIDKRATCTTCKNTYSGTGGVNDCPGHFGHLQVRPTRCGAGAGRREAGRRPAARRMQRVMRGCAPARALLPARCWRAARRAPPSARRRGWWCAHLCRGQRRRSAACPPRHALARPPAPVSLTLPRRRPPSHPRPRSWSRPCSTSAS